MSDAGLTNGAFYAHFDSKDDLVANVVADQLRTQMKKCGTLRPGREGLEDFLREYLSPEHRDNPGDGCPSAALLDEVGRCGGGTKDAYTDGARAIVEELAVRLAPEDPQSARGKAIGLFTMAVGNLAVVPRSLRFFVGTILSSSPLATSTGCWMTERSCGRASPSVLAVEVGGSLFATAGKLDPRRFA